MPSCNIFQHFLRSSSKFNDIKYACNNVERLLEPQGEVVNEQKMLIYQILSKFPFEVVVELEDTKKCEEEWTMELIVKEVIKPAYYCTGNTQRRVANAKGRVNTYDTRHIKQEDSYHLN